MPSDDEANRAASRREAIGLLGGLIAAPTLLAPAGAAAQTKAESAATVTRRALVDPREAYPKPPFPKQTQDWPGLASRMQPRPDHGEKSYVGSGRLAGRKALVTGGNSGIGRAAVIAYAREGADVAINYLPAEEEDAREVVQLIRAEGRKAVALPGDIREEAFCRQVTIINTASVVAQDPPAQLLDYAATKAAIIAFTQALARQLADKGIRVNAVAPGPF